MERKNFPLLCFCLFLIVVSDYATALRFLNQYQPVSGLFPTTGTDWIPKQELERVTRDGMSSSIKIQAVDDSQLKVPMLDQNMPVRRGPFECSTHRECRLQLLNHFNNIMKLNKSGKRR